MAFLIITPGASGDIVVDSITTGDGSLANPAYGFADASVGLYVLFGSLSFKINSVEQVRFSNGFIRTDNDNGPALTRASSSSTVATLLPRISSANTGIGSAATGDLAVVVNSVTGRRYIESGGGVLALSQITAGITADTGSSQGDGPLTSSINQISVCANAGDAVTMPSAVAGYLVEIYNDGANAMDVFPASGDNLGAGADTAVSLAAGANITYRSIDVTNWKVRT
ncbi:MAG: hypothetical protein V3U75_01235 [Methylococcaceae bacterium]